MMQNNKGQGLTEYLILLALIAMATIVTVRKFGEVVEERVEKAKEKVVSEIEI